MKILGIDFGQKKIGIALSEGIIAQPLAVIRFDKESEALAKINQFIKKEKIDKLVVGLSEGKTARETKAFAESLKKNLGVAVEFFDETLSTVEAQELSQKTGMNRKKRKEMEDAFAAAVMLQSYLDHV